MREKNVRALPVLRRQGTDKHYTGIISSFDLMSFIAFAAYFKYYSAINNFPLCTNF